MRAALCPVQFRLARARHRERGLGGEGAFRTASVTACPSTFASAMVAPVSGAPGAIESASVSCAM
jgi:hypothetical protein